MSGRLFLSAALLLTAGFAPAPFPKAARRDPGADDLRKLQGEWALIEQSYGGTSTVRDGLVLTITRDRWAFSLGGREASRWQARIYPASTPRAVDLRLEADATRELKGIYFIEGSKLTFLYDTARRPTGYESGGARCWKMVFQRR
jgi:uncharacterized protein (TIGR03067 family)